MSRKIDLGSPEHLAAVERALLADNPLLAELTVPVPVEERLLAELALMSDDVLVEYVLQDDYYTPSHWEAVAQLELDRRGKGDLPKRKVQSRCVHAPIFVHEGVCKACGKTGLR